jgi:hypothetical protein
MTSDNSFRAIMRRMPLMAERDLRAAIVQELDGERRLMVLERLHQRYCKLRAERERQALLDPKGEHRDF